MIYNQNTGLNVSSGTVVVSSGLISAFFGHRSFSKKTAPGIYMRWGLTLVSGIFLYSMAIVAYTMAQVLASTKYFVASDAEITQNAIRGIVLLTIVFSLSLSLRTNINYVGLHRFYRGPVYGSIHAGAGKRNGQYRQFFFGRGPIVSCRLMAPPNVGTAEARKRLLPYPIINTNAI